MNRRSFLQNMFGLAVVSALPIPVIQASVKESEENEILKDFRGKDGFTLIYDKRGKLFGYSGHGSVTVQFDRSRGVFHGTGSIPIVVPVRPVVHGSIFVENISLIDEYDDIVLDEDYTVVMKNGRNKLVTRGVYFDSVSFDVVDGNTKMVYADMMFNPEDQFNDESLTKYYEQIQKMPQVSSVRTKGV